MITLLDAIAIGERIGQERKKLNLGRDKLAELVGVTPYYMGQIERGDRNMSLNTLDKISDCLHVTIGYLIDGKEKTPVDLNELQELINKCSQNEITLFTDVLKAAMPHLHKFK